MRSSRACERYIYRYDVAGQAISGYLLQAPKKKVSCFLQLLFRLGEQVLKGWRKY